MSPTIDPVTPRQAEAEALLRRLLTRAHVVRSAPLVELRMALPPWLVDELAAWGAGRECDEDDGTAEPDADGEPDADSEPDDFAEADAPPLEIADPSPPAFGFLRPRPRPRGRAREV